MTVGVDGDRVGYRKMFFVMSGTADSTWTRAVRVVIGVRA